MAEPVGEGNAAGGRMNVGPRREGATATPAATRTAAAHALAADRTSDPA